MGAGPAGSTAARECATLGMSVLVLDQAQFPRDKPCGGGVNLRAAQLLPFDLAPVIEQVIYGARFSLGYHPLFTAHSTRPLSYFTQRSRLDGFLVERALKAGARLRERAPVSKVERYPNHVMVYSGSERFEARSLIAADGANGKTARLAGLDVRRILDIAIEGNVAPPGGVPSEWTGMMGLDISSVPGGMAGCSPRETM